MHKAFLEALAAIVGSRHVLSGEDAAPYTTDWRKQYRGRALCVARPGNTEEAAAVLRACAAHAVAIVPQGGNTGLSGGSVPTGAQSEIVLSLSRMNRIRALDPLNDTITVEAG